MYDLGDVVVWSVFVLICVLFWRAQGVREVALKAAKKHCEEMDVQWLDSNVSLRGLWFKRDHRGSICFWRSYTFEFSSTGEERYSGRVVLVGNRVTSVQLEPHRLH